MRADFSPNLLPFYLIKLVKILPYGNWFFCLNLKEPFKKFAAISTMVLCIFLSSLLRLKFYYCDVPLRTFTIISYWWTDCVNTVCKVVKLQIISVHSCSFSFCKGLLASTITTQPALISPRYPMFSLEGHKSAKKP